MLPNVLFCRMVAQQLDVVKPVETAVVVFPEVEVVQLLRRLKGGIFRGGGKRLEMRLADQRRLIAVLVQGIVDGGGCLRELCPQCPRPMVGGVHPREDARTGRGAGGIGAVGAGAQRPLRGQPVQIGRFQFRVDGPEHGVVLLVGGDQ